MTQSQETPEKKPKPRKIKTQKAVTIRFAGDSGDGMQLAGSQFTDTSALMGNDVATFPDFPAEIRAPIGTLPGVSSFQIQFSESVIFTPGDLCDVLVAMNPAALKVDLHNVKKGGLVVANQDVFTEDNLKKANWSSNPLTDDTLQDYQVIKVNLSQLTRKALDGHPLKLSEIERCKNFYALGIAFWLYNRDTAHTEKWVKQKFAKRPEIVNANITAIKAGYQYADVTELISFQYEVKPAPIEPGVYRKVTGNEATAIGLVAASQLAGKTLVYASYPITPASDILHELAKRKNYGVKTIQSEDEIAACGSALGAAFGGQIGVTASSGPGICLKSEMMGLAVVAELPMVVIDVQRAGPSTGMPTKTEQGDLLQVMFGRNGESPLPIMAPRTPAECFEMAILAVRIAIRYMTPVVFLSDGYLANGAEPWKLPEIGKLEKIEVKHPKAGKEKFFPYQRDDTYLARPWAIPGIPGLEHRIGGLAKADITGDVSYDPENNQRMIDLRAEKVRRIAQDIPDIEVTGSSSGKLLVLGWGSTFGVIYQAVSDLQKEKINVSHAQLNFLNPFPKNLGDVLKGFDKVLIPELNMGQLLMLIRFQFPEVRAVGLNKVQGQPFKVAEIVKKVQELS